MLILLPYLIVALGISIGLCSAAGYTGALLAVMLIVFFIAGCLGILLLYLLFLWVVSLFARRYETQTRPEPFYTALTGYSFGLLLAILRVRLHFTGEERLPEGRWLLVSNHRSAIDPIATERALWKRGVIFISKPENLRIPIAGPIGAAAGFLAIDRENDRAALRTILAAADLLKNDVTSVAVYPEGTRSHETGMLPFRNGVFKIAQKARVPVVVASIRGSDQVLRRFPWRATDVYLNICGVIDAEQVMQSKTQEIGETAQEWINASVNT